MVAVVGGPMPVRVHAVVGMPFGVQVWIIEGRDSGEHTLYIDAGLIASTGVEALEQAFNAATSGRRRLDADEVYSTLRTVTG